jgi:hypothetical protein
MNVAESLRSRSGRELVDGRACLSKYEQRSFRDDGDAPCRAYAAARLLGAISSFMLPLLKDL